MKDEWEGFLKKVLPFRALPPEAVRRVAELSFEKELQKEEALFHEGTPSHHVWIVKEGRIHLEHFHPNGKVSSVCVMVEGETFCCLPALDRKAYPATAVAKTKSKVIGIPSQVFSELMGKYPLFSQQALATFCSRLREVERIGGCHNYDSAEKRVVEVLLTLVKKFGSEIPLTREEIAELSGLTVETTIRTTSLLKKKRLLVSQGKKSLRVDEVKLKNHLTLLGNMI